MQKIVLPGGIKAPGAFWSILFIVAVAVIHRYVADPFWFDVALAIVGVALPMLVDNNVQLKQAISIIRLLTGGTVIAETEVIPENPATRMRSPAVVLPADTVRVANAQAPDTPPVWKTVIFG